MVWSEEDTIAIIPYYGGDEGYRRGSKKENRLAHLKKTVESLKGKASIKIFTCNSEDTSNINIEGITINTLKVENPKHLIYEMCLFAQNNLSVYDYVLYTDSDHEFIIKEEAFENLPKGSYVVPHRLEEVVGVKGLDRGFPHDKGVIINYSPKGRVTNLNDAYSGCYLCHKEDFDKITFTNLDNGFIGEQPAGFNVFQSGLNCFKLGLDEFMVEHLSGRDYHESL